MPVDFGQKIRPSTMIPTASTVCPLSPGPPAGAAGQPEPASRILDLALELFEQFGFEGTSTELLAQKANVSKATIYKLFGPKDELLIASVTHGCRKVQASIDLSPLHRPPFSQALMVVARCLVEAFWSEPCLRLLRLVTSEARRSPHIGAAFLAAGPRPVIDVMARHLASAMDRNELRRADPQVRADQFLSLMLGHTQLALLLQQRKRTTSAEREAHARHAVEFFLGLDAPV
ncbi:TetR/AcrR family transcriptional regulator [Burkholderia cenocepacia]|uniref:TetR/AcrR family transcriptional regulator n=1 Tax=Burkholderia cenocepacia TaxID=95486 RepID=UPI002AB6F4C4|nr:TetR/AcrR family transcriptional regulator [Burkholderia cenocepacia]